jgi:hypothetical protein
MSDGDVLDDRRTVNYVKGIVSERQRAGFVDRNSVETKFRFAATHSRPVDIGDPNISRIIVAPVQNRENVCPVLRANVQNACRPIDREKLPEKQSAFPPRILGNSQDKFGR